MLVIKLKKISNDNIITKIISIINKIRPFLLNDGGNLEFVEYKDNIVYIRLLGACSKCDMIDITLKNEIEQIIMNEIPEVKEVKNIN